MNSSLDENVRVKIGRDTFAVWSFLNKKVKGTELLHYKTTSRDPQLTRSDSIPFGPSVSIHGHLFLQDPKSQNLYNYEESGYGGDFTGDGDQTLYDSATLSRLLPEFDVPRLQNNFNNYFNSTGRSPDQIPKDLFSARLVLSTSTHWVAGADIDYVGGKDSTLIIEGSQCELFKEVYEHLTSEKSN